MLANEPRFSDAQFRILDILCIEHYVLELDGKCCLEEEECEVRNLNSAMAILFLPTGSILCSFVYEHQHWSLRSGFLLYLAIERHPLSLPLFSGTTLAAIPSLETIVFLKGPPPGPIPHKVLVLALKDHLKGMTSSFPSFNCLCIPCWFP